MKITVLRGEFRRVLQQLQPHMGVPAGKNDAKEYHPYGRMRFAVAPDDRLVAWAGDQLTRACASLPIFEYKDPHAPIFDLTVEDVAGILKTFRPTGDADARQMWLAGMFELSILDDRFTVLETFDMHQAGKELTFPLTIRSESQNDTYPDFPSTIMSVLAAPLAPAVEAYPSREALFRALAAVHPNGRMRILESSREALIVGGTTSFTAIVPAKLLRGDGNRLLRTLGVDIVFDAVIEMLRPFVQPIDESTPEGKARATMTRMLDAATIRDEDRENHDG